MSSRFKYIVAEEVDGLMQPSRKLLISADQITPALEADLYAAANLAPGAFPPPPPPWPIGSVPFKRGDVIPSVLNAGFYAFERGGTYTLPGGVRLGGGVKIVAWGEGANPLLLVPSLTNGGIFGYGSAVKDKAGLQMDNVDLFPVDPKATDRGDGIVIRGNIGPIILNNVTVTGFEQNVSFSGDAANSPIIVNGLMTAGAWASNKVQGDLFKGQGVYFEATGSIVPVFTDLVSYNNGIPLHAPEQWNTAERSSYCHGFYHQAASVRIKFVRPAFVRNQAAGLQTRSGAEIIDPVFVDNQIGLLNVGTMTGRTTVTNFVVVGGHRVWMGENWDGINAVYTYDPLLLDRGTVIGLAGQEKPDPVLPSHRSASFNSGGCINLASGQWSPSHALCQVQQTKPDGTKFYGGTLEARGVTVYAWVLGLDAAVSGRVGGMPKDGITYLPKIAPVVTLPPITRGYNAALRANVATAIASLPSK